ncbi:MAG: nucleoside triphosphate pyrophosphatase [Woeseiaceae bacterium]|nr:nucleoside triphosphate pyrophosphatase [Woeseiaceae bacterium]
MRGPALHLASASPRRSDLLKTLGLEFSQAGEALDETRLAGELAGDMVLRLACDKARAASLRRVDRAVLGADTAVVLGEQIFGKPRSRTDALDMLAALSGRTHEVVTGVAVLFEDVLQTALSRSRVRFRELAPGEAAAYWDSREPRDKAGAYALQGRGAGVHRRNRRQLQRRYRLAVVRDGDHAGSCRYRRAATRTTQGMTV